MSSKRSSLFNFFGNFWYHSDVMTCGCRRTINIFKPAGGMENTERALEIRSLNNYIYQSKMYSQSLVLLQNRVETRARSNNTEPQRIQRGQTRASRQQASNVPPQMNCHPLEAQSLAWGPFCAFPKMPPRSSSSPSAHAGS